MTSPIKAIQTIIEGCFAAFAALLILAIVTDVYGTYSFEGGTEPFYQYNTNTAIRAITSLYLASLAVFVCSYILRLFKKWENSNTLRLTYLIAACTAGICRWAELYYGATFYYGEVRDKQGLMFPLFSSLLFSLVIWNIQFPKRKGNNFVSKLLLLTVVNAGLWILWLTG